MWVCQRKKKKEWWVIRRLCTSSEERFFGVVLVTKPNKSIQERCEKNNIKENLKEIARVLSKRGW